MWYSHKSFLVQANKVEEDGVLETCSGNMNVFKNEYILCDEFGNCTPITEKRFRESYVPVERMKVIPEFTEEQVALNYAQNWSNFDDEEYIVDFQRRVRERNKSNELGL